MPQDDKELVQRNDFTIALGLLSRLPIKVNIKAATDRGGAAAWAYPLAGACIGFIAVLLGTLAQLLGLPDIAVTVVILGSLMMVTGALHEDGLADTFDGLWGGHDASSRLAIMKDSAVGTYGMLALGLGLIARFSMIHMLVAADASLAIIGVAALSRAPLVVMMSNLPNARANGLSQSVGKPSIETALLALIVGLSLSLVFSGPLAMLHGAVLVACLTMLLAYTAKQKIGGQTGDILGASQQIAEVTLLATCVGAFAV